MKKFGLPSVPGIYVFAAVFLGKKLGGTAFATPPYKTNRFFIYKHYYLSEPTVNYFC